MEYNQSRDVTETDSFTKDGVTEFLHSAEEKDRVDFESAKLKKVLHSAEGLYRLDFESARAHQLCCPSDLTVDDRRGLGVDIVASYYQIMTYNALFILACTRVYAWEHTARLHRK